MEMSDWYGVPTPENAEWYIAIIVVLFLLQAYLFWRTK